MQNPKRNRGDLDLNWRGWRCRLYAQEEPQVESSDHELEGYMTTKRPPIERSEAGVHSRREFLQTASAITAGLITAPLAGTEAGAALPTIALGPHRVTRLIAGGNPMARYSHFNRLLDQLMVEYFTEERKIEFLLNCQKAGINTWQASYNERLFGLLREAGWKMNWLWLTDLERRKNFPGAPDVISQCRSIPETERPLGMVHHGETTDVFFREGNLDRIVTFINAVHDLGLLAGISTHNPRVVETVEEKGWEGGMVSVWGTGAAWAPAARWGGVWSFDGCCASPHETLIPNRRVPHRNCVFDRILF